MALEFLDPRLAAHFHAPAPSLNVLPDAAHADDRPTGRESRSFHVFQQAFDGDVRIVDLCANRVDYFTKIVRRNVRRHAHGDAGAAVDEEVWESCRKNRWLRSCLVI